MLWAYFIMLIFFFSCQPRTGTFFSLHSEILMGFLAGNAKSVKTWDFGCPWTLILLAIPTWSPPAPYQYLSNNLSFSTSLSPAYSVLVSRPLLWCTEFIYLFLQTLRWQFACCSSDEFKEHHWSDLFHCFSCKNQESDVFQAFVSELKPEVWTRFHYLSRFQQLCKFMSDIKPFHRTFVKTLLLQRRPIKTY